MSIEECRRSDDDLPQATIVFAALKGTMLPFLFESVEDAQRFAWAINVRSIEGASFTAAVCENIRVLDGRGTAEAIMALEEFST